MNRTWEFNMKEQDFGYGIEGDDYTPEGDGF